MSYNSDLSQGDMARYREAIAGIDLSAEQKDEIILIVRSIMQSFVDQAFDVDPVQLSLLSRPSDSSQNKMPYANLLGVEACKVAGSMNDSEINEIGM